MILRALLTAALALTPALALATPLTLEGDYAFQSSARANGAPVCTERWSFHGAEMTVTSGQEVSRNRFRVEEQAGNQILIDVTLETNGAPDCMGHRSEGPRQEERRVLLLPMNSGETMVCPAPPEKAAGPVAIGGDCYGNLRPANAAH